MKIYTLTSQLRLNTKKLMLIVRQARTDQARTDQARTDQARTDTASTSVRIPLLRGAACVSTGRSSQWLAVALLMVMVLFAGQPHFARVGDASTAADAVLLRQTCTGVYHIVRPGQTIYYIASAYGTTAYRIARCNGLKSYTVYVGQAILVPIASRSRG